MKKVLLLTVLFSSLLFSCFPDDSDSGAEPDGPITVNVRFEVVTTRNTEAVITTTIDNETQTDDVENLPFSLTYSQTEVEAGTFLRLTYLENGAYVVTNEGSSWTDYTAVLSIYVNNALAVTESFNITEDDAGLRDVIFTFN